MRRVTEHKKETFDGEELLIVTIWEEGLNKQEVRKRNPFSKKHEVLVSNGQSYTFKRKNA